MSERKTFNFVMTEEDREILFHKKPNKLSRDEFLREVLEFALLTKQIPENIKDLRIYRGQFRTETEKIEQLTERAKELGYSASEYMVKAIRAYKKRGEK